VRGEEEEGGEGEGREGSGREGEEGAKDAMYFFFRWGIRVIERDRSEIDRRGREEAGGGEEDSMFLFPLSFRSSLFSSSSNVPPSSVPIFFSSSLSKFYARAKHEDDVFS